METEKIAVTVTCETPDCENSGAPITLDIPPGCPVICGPCGATLTPESEATE